MLRSMRRLKAMKTLILMRHGKAADFSPQGDKSRTLTKRGEIDAEAAGKSFARCGTLDCVVTSDALRTQRTAEFAARGAGFTGKIILEPDIYEAEWEDLLAVVHQMPNTAEIGLLVGHNPGISDLAVMLGAAQPNHTSLPPAGSVVLQTAAERWQDVGTDQQD
jgi:phosphohistidine phosphatase